jgi:tRNA A37 methylthiotransferase MiaB
MDTVNITRFSARPGTDAASMTPVHGRISKDRSAELTNVKNEIEGEVNRNLVGKKFVVLATEKGKDGTVTRTGNYRPIVVKDVIELGTFLEVEVVDSRPTYLLGKIV